MPALILPDVPIHSSSPIRKSKIKGSGITPLGISSPEFQTVTLNTGSRDKKHRDREAAIRTRTSKLAAMAKANKSLSPSVKIASTEE